MAVIIDYSYYPFIADVNSIIDYRWPGASFTTLADPENVIGKRALTLLERIIRGRDISRGQLSAEEEVVAYYVLISVVKALGDRRLINRVAIAYSKHAYEKLRHENIPTLVAIARRLGINIIETRNPPRIPVKIIRGTLAFISKPFAVYFKDYLKFSARLSGEPKYRIVNQIVHKGYVYLDKEVFPRILEEAITIYIQEQINKLNVDLEALKPILEKAREILSRTNWHRIHVSIEQGGKSEAIGIIDFESFPPCMSKIVEALRSGENLSHQARFTITAFLARIGMDVDDILELFRNVPDFNEKIARYQIEHIAGLRGSRKQYMPYSCQTMKSLGLCPIVGDCGAKNPLTVYRRNLWRKKKLGKKASGKEQKQENS
ncbi:MAG: DNA primase large subunit PriL [Crenarchaeota archaeon]|nr:DNA primase large subunit PriL [Thermoproteota archaeon]